MSAPPVINAPQNVHDLLERLHSLSLEQEKHLAGETGGYSVLREAWGKDPVAAKKLSDDMMRDKFIALTVDKALFVYQLLRATGATNIVEAGTSYGVSTIYLALAVGENAKAQGKAPGAAKVIATENEPEKIARAKEHWKEAGESVLPWIELREGDLLQTLKADLPDQIDFVLLDIWTPVVLPTLKLLEPKLRRGAVIIADNTIDSVKGYADFFAHINAPGSHYRTITMPYPGGLEMTVYDPPA